MIDDIEVPWPSDGSGGSTSIDFEMQRDTIYACHFKTPATMNAGQGHVSVVEFNGQPSAHDGCLSTTRGELNSPIPGQSMSFAGDVAPSVAFLGADPGAGAGPNKRKMGVLLPNTDYYFNIQLQNPPDSGVFNRKLTFQKPRKGQ